MRRTIFFSYLQLVLTTKELGHSPAELQAFADETPFLVILKAIILCVIKIDEINKILPGMSETENNIIKILITIYF